MLSVYEHQVMRARKLSAPIAGAVCAISVFAYATGETARGDNVLPLAIGAGGYITGMDIATDGTKIIRNDTYGAHHWNGTRWRQIVSVDTMPSEDIGFNNKTGEWFAVPQGTYEIVLAPSDSNVAYMHFNGYIYRTENLSTGPRWTRTACEQAAKGTTDPNSPGKIFGKKIAVDPQNPNVFVAGYATFVRYSTDGGATCGEVMGVAAALQPNGTNPGYAIVADPTSPVVGQKHQGWFIASYGRGVYHSAEGPGGPYILTPGTPTTHTQMSWQGGRLWLVPHGKSFGPSSYSGSAWSAKDTKSPTTYVSLAVDPRDANRLLLFDDGGRLIQSLDGGTTWTSPYYYAFPKCSGCIRSTDIPWLEEWTKSKGSTYNGYLSLGSAQFDPTSTNKIYLATGTGVMWGALPTSYVGYSLNDQSIGIEQLVGNEIRVPPGQRPVVFSWDRPIFYSSANDVFPSGYGVNYKQPIMMGWSGDYSPNNPNIMVSLVNYFGVVDNSARSTDGGRSWREYATKPPTTPSGQATIGGSIAAASDTDAIIVQNNGPSAGVFYTKNSGVTWTEAKVGDVPSVASGRPTGWAGTSYTLNRRVVTCSRVTPGKCWLFNAGLNQKNSFAGVYRTTDSGANWSRVYSGVITTHADSLFNVKLLAVPDRDDHLWYTGGGQTGNSMTDKPFLRRSTNSGISWSDIAGVKNVHAIGFGKKAAGAAYPAVYVAGFVSIDGGKTYDWGVYRSINAERAVPTWTLLTRYPGGSADSITWIEGSLDTYGLVYFAFRGSGYAYGQFD